VVSRRSRGYSLMEIVVALAVFGFFMAIIAVLSSDMRRSEKKWPVNFMKHPQISAVLFRLRRDVQDSISPFYPPNGRHGGYEQGDQVLIIHTLVASGSSEWVVWDFRKAGVIERRAFTLLGGQVSLWTATGVPPSFKVDIEAVEFPNRPYGIRIQALDEGGVLAIDQILQPRAY
jgi:prepilin-type N-terminal cleavage/methylation domain-containing protein